MRFNRFLQFMKNEMMWECSDMSDEYDLMGYEHNFQNEISKIVNSSSRANEIEISRRFEEQDFEVLSHD